MMILKPRASGEGRAHALERATNHRAMSQKVSYLFFKNNHQPMPVSPFSLLAVALVFIIGGMTYSEAAALRLLSSQGTRLQARGRERDVLVLMTLDQGGQSTWQAPPILSVEIPFFILSSNDSTSGVL